MLGGGGGGDVVVVVVVGVCEELAEDGASGGVVPVTSTAGRSRPNQRQNDRVQ